MTVGRIDARLERVEGNVGVLKTKVTKIEHHLGLNGAPKPKRPAKKR